MELEEALNILAALGRCSAAPHNCIGCPRRDIVRSACNGMSAIEVIEAGKVAERLLLMLQRGEAAVVPTA